MVENLEQNRRFIEQFLPIRMLGNYSRGEQGSTKRISMIHRWWGRRKQSVSRATILASLLNEKIGKDFEEVNKLIEDFCPLDESYNQKLLNKAWNLIKQDRGNDPLFFWDPFAGGGTLPAEAQRLGLQVYASDLNPVSVLIQKASFEFPPKFGMKSNIDMAKTDYKLKKSILGDEVRKWGHWVIEHAKKELEPYFPLNQKGIIPSIYFWCHTIPCSNPACKRQMPLQKQPLLSKKRGIALVLEKDPLNLQYNVEIKTITGSQKIKSPTGSQGTTKCIFCDQTTKGNEIRKFAQNGQMKVQLLAKMAQDEEKVYEKADQNDIKATQLAESHVSEIDADLIPKTYVDAYNAKGKQRTIGRPHLYGWHMFKDFFIPRQLISVTTILKWIKLARKEMTDKGLSDDLVNIVNLYLALTLDKYAEYNTRLTVWHALIEVPSQTASRYSFDIGWDFPEVYPFSGGSGSFNHSLKLISSFLDNESQIPSSVIKVWQHDAGTVSDIKSGTVDLVVTDPPYYGSIFYAGLSDFFYSLLKLSQKQVFPKLFEDEATPKVNECVLALHRYSTFEEAKNAYETKLGNALKEIRRVLKPDGLCIIIFAHVDPEAWDALITAILNAELQITAAWPITTENAAAFGLGGQTLSSTIQIVCRSRPNNRNETTYDKFKLELKKSLPLEFDRLWNLQFSGVNLDIAMLGPAIALFGRYKTVLDLMTGEPVPVIDLLNVVRAEVLELQWKKLMSTYLINIDEQIHLQRVDPITRFYVLFRAEFGQKINADGIYQLSRAISLDFKYLDQLGYLQKKKQDYWVPTAFNRPHPDKLMAHQGPSTPLALVDILHGAQLANQANILKQFLMEGQIDALHPMWALAQLLSNITPIKEERTSLQDLLSNRTVEKYRAPESLDEYFDKSKK